MDGHFPGGPNCTVKTSLSWKARPLDDVIKWKHFPSYWPFLRGIHRSPQRPMAWSFGVFFDLRRNKRLSKQSWGWWFETPSRPLWLHCNANGIRLIFVLQCVQVNNKKRKSTFVRGIYRRTVDALTKGQWCRKREVKRAYSSSRQTFHRPQ